MSEISTPRELFLYDPIEARQLPTDEWRGRVEPGRATDDAPCAER